MFRRAATVKIDVSNAILDPIVEALPSTSQGPTFMLHMQAEEEKKFSLKSLGEENIRLSQECTSLRTALVLSEEQVIIFLKIINAEYLVNVIKKFFMSVDLSEREKLVLVICSILHIPADESHAIKLKWTVSMQQTTATNYSGGIVVGNGAVLRWLFQPTDN